MRELPPILYGTAEEQIKQIYEYLLRVAIKENEEEDA